MDEPEESRIRRVAPLIQDEERSLIEKMRSGDETARQRLVEANLRLVLNIAKTYRQSAVRAEIPFSEMVLAGREGLNRALDRFDPQKGFRLSTYATHWIRQAIGRRLDQGKEMGTDSPEAAPPSKEFHSPRRPERSRPESDERLVLELLEKVKRGDDDALARLFELYDDLVDRIAQNLHHRFWNRKPLEDLRLAGRSGLMQAAQGFDPTQGLRFSTYATHLIRQAILRKLGKA